MSRHPCTQTLLYGWVVRLFWIQTLSMFFHVYSFRLIFFMFAWFLKYDLLLLIVYREHQYINKAKTISSACLRGHGWNITIVRNTMPWCLCQAHLRPVPVTHLGDQMKYAAQLSLLNFVRNRTCAVAHIRLFLSLFIAMKSLRDSINCSMIFAQIPPL